MRFWDSSGVVPLIVQEGRTGAILALAEVDCAVWWGTRTECLSALARLVREGIFSAQAAREVTQTLEHFISTATEIQPTEQVRARAERLLRIHPLRAADAFQLASALILFGEETNGQEFVTLDDRLRSAAEKEGFTVLP